MIVAPESALACGAALAEADFRALRRRMIFEWGKWDPQTGDHDAIASFPLLVSPEAWAELREAAEQLFAEAIEAERELAARPELHGRLGLPGAVRRALAEAASDPPTAGPRLIRFDFHLTPEGWRISEGNTDVPGGFIEAAGLAALYSELATSQGWVQPPAPGAALASALSARHGEGAAIALVHASAFTDDRQVMLHLARELALQGLDGRVLSPDQLAWEGGVAYAAEPAGRRRLEAIFRFYPGEWLPELARSVGWMRFFRGAGTPQSNPPSALLTQSKRFPLAWDALRAPLDTWRRLLPEVRDPARVRHGDEAWVLKPAMGRVGEDILVHGVTPAGDRRRIERWSRWRPSEWAAQRRFAVVGLPSPIGTVYPSVGVFVIDCRVAGIYGRLAQRPLVDKSARDCPVFIGSREHVELASAGVGQ